MAPSKLLNKKAQIWGMDLIFALTIFSIGILIFFIFTINKAQEDEFDKISEESSSVMNAILSEGSPKNWNETSVNEIGILTQNKINQTKLEKFYNLSLEDFEKTKEIFRTNYNYFFFFENMQIQNNPVEGIGINYSNHSYLIKQTRFTIYNETPTTAKLYLWK